MTESIYWTLIFYVLLIQMMQNRLLDHKLETDYADWLQSVPMKEEGDFP